MYTEQDFEEARKKKKYDIGQYWELRKQGVCLMPWDFGCVDWEHNESGQLDDWVPANPDAQPVPEERQGLYPEPIPLEKQKYSGEPSDSSRWDNLQAGWSKRVDQGMVSDYWRDYDLWN